MKTISHLYPKIVSIDNLLVAWEEFIKDKKQKADVRIFAQYLVQNIFSLNHDLINFTYKHAGYQRFDINDPKSRIIHKATVRDRLVHHAIYRVLYPIFDKSFIYDSYSCRLGKGTHKAVERLENFTRIVSRNYTKPCLVLKCDVKKFFDSVDHAVLLELLQKKISDPDTMWLLKEIINSFDKPNRVQLELFERERERERGRSAAANSKGIPIGNLTSQLFANVYMNELDQFIKRKLKIKYYLRYCDDFIIFTNESLCLQELIVKIESFLSFALKLRLHENKVDMRKLNQGIDFLGYVVRPHCCVLRTKTKKRMFMKVNKNNLASYMGLLDHCDGYKLRQKLDRITKIEKIEILD